MTINGVRWMISALALAGAVTVLTAAQDTTALLSAARQALGGEAALNAVTSFTMTGSVTREFDGHESNLQVEINCVLPDKFVETERQSLSRGPLGDAFLTYVSGFNGDTPIFGSSSTDSQMPLPPAPTNPPVSGFQRMFAELTLPMFAASFAGAPLTFTSGTDGNALDVAAPANAKWHLVFDPATHLLSRMTWMGKPIVSFSTTSTVTVGARGQVLSSSQPPAFPTGDPTVGLPDVPWELVASDYTIANGLNWPHTIARSTGGKPRETLRVGKIVINPKIDPKKFTPTK